MHMNEQIICNGPGEGCYNCPYAEEFIDRWATERRSIWCTKYDRDVTKEIKD